MLCIFGSIIPWLSVLLSLPYFACSRSFSRPSGAGFASWRNSSIVGNLFFIIICGPRFRTTMGPDYAIMGPEISVFLLPGIQPGSLLRSPRPNWTMGYWLYMVDNVATFCSRQFFLLGQSLLLYSSVEWWPGASFWTKGKMTNIFPEAQGDRNQVSCNMRNKAWTFSFLCRFCLSSPPPLPPIPFSYQPMERKKAVSLERKKIVTQIFLQQKLHLQTLFESALLAEPAGEPWIIMRFAFFPTFSWDCQPGRPHWKHTRTPVIVIMIVCSNRVAKIE